MMKIDKDTRKQAEFLYQAAAKPLYNMAYYTIGDRRLAEQTAAEAFLDACKNIPRDSSAELFVQRCFSLLYGYVKNARLPVSLNAGAGIKPLEQLLAPMSFDERYVILLFCRQKYTVRQIAEITGLHESVVENRLTSAALKNGSVVCGTA